MDSRAKTEITVQGIGASQGIAYGQIFVYLQSDVEVPSYQVEPEKRIDEVARFDRALVVTRQQISKIKNEVEKNIGPEEAAIFDAHLMVLEDEALIGETIREFNATGCNIETCFQKVSSRYVQAFSEIDDEYLRERAGDLRDVAQRVLQNLLGQAENALNRLVDQRIIVGRDISPSESATLDRSAALALVMDSGSRTSHAVIVARSMKIPSVVGVRNLTQRVRNGDWAIVDGYDGLVILNPSESTLFRYGKIQERKRSFEARLLEANRQPATTLDGVTVPLLANIEKAEEVAKVKSFSADGVGLYRTEFLFLSAARMPNEQEQFLAYKTVVEAMAPAPVIIRTLDLGGDKPLAGKSDLFPKETNPFMGFRAIRFCLEHVDIFKEQLRAILRASAYGQAKIMYPMISGNEELARANAVLAECRAELKAKGVPFDEKIEVGTMIEIPSAAATADLLAQECAFFSIGTNDLIQYMLAIDRVNDRIAHLYEPTHPAILRTLRGVVTEAHKRKISVSVCGEMAGDPVYAPLLLGLGIDSLSMSPAWLPSVKYLIREMTMADARKLAEEALAMGSAKEIYAKCDAFYRARVRMD
ncbi:MAG: phosphoenolpyruvate--protein phosphotransferase [Opitutia bacterium Tous-C1TDCM]|nr:MAG: phosphoenolpyruvate--protein phosphotransferase [Opitutae bacterium Tous-C1TDCM]PAW70923.1 MAG: phosphoenolpyruvate--protein phosphotransferase [Verrucomicrobiae bacterium Tous-C4TDCM]